MDKRNNTLLQGTLDLLILRSLRDESRHGWGIQQRINQIAQDELLVNQGSLYPALVRLVKQGHLNTEWQTTENGRRAKYYELTQSGRQQLDTQLDQWKRYAKTIDLILATI